MFIPKHFIVVQNGKVTNHQQPIFMIKEGKYDEGEGFTTTTYVRRGAIYIKLGVMDDEVTKSSLVMFRCEEEEKKYKYLIFTIKELHDALSDNILQVLQEVEL